MSTIVCLGDSITAGYPYTEENSWVHLCQDKLNLNLINAGISNDTVADMLARYKTDVTPHKPSAVIILAGTNDAWQEIPLKVTTDNFNELIAKVREEKSMPVLGLPAPIIKAKVKSYYKQQNVEAFNSQLNNIREWISEFAQKSGIYLLDFYSPLCQQGTDQGQVDLYCEDGGHPNTKGYITIAASIEQKLLELAGNLQVL